MGAVPSYCRSPDPGVGFDAVVTQSPNSLVSAVPVERRQAIWPWILMPLATLVLFFALNQLRKTQESEASGSGSHSSITVSDDPGSP